jgi:signal transduction histidine kinase
VAKHAQTDEATVECESGEGRIVLRVSDAGVGYDPSQRTAMPSRGLGLLSLHERLLLIGGTTEVRSVVSEGTVTELSAPLDATSLQNAASLPREQPS